MDPIKTLMQIIYDARLPARSPRLIHQFISRNFCRKIRLKTKNDLKFGHSFKHIVIVLVESYDLY